MTGVPNTACSPARKICSDASGAGGIGLLGAGLQTLEDMVARLISSPGTGRRFDRMRKRLDFWGVDTRREYKLILAKRSNLSRAHRDFIVASHEFYCEQYNLNPCT